jgi:hypothetical protein
LGGGGSIGRSIRRSGTGARVVTPAKSNKMNAIGGEGSIRTLPDLDYKRPVITQGSLGKILMR